MLGIINMKKYLSITVVILSLALISCIPNSTNNLNKPESTTFYDKSGNLDHHVLTTNHDSLILYYFPNKIIKEIKYFYHDTIVYYKKFNMSGDIIESVIKPTFEISGENLVVRLRYLYFKNSSIGITFGKNPELKTIEDFIFSSPKVTFLSIPLSEIPKTEGHRIKGRIIEYHPPNAVLGFYDFDIDINNLPAARL